MFLKTFSCQCWPNLRPYNNHKMSFRSLPCIFLGYRSSHHGYMCFHVHTAIMYISSDVLFDENNFPFFTSNSSPSPECYSWPNPTHNQLPFFPPSQPHGPSSPSYSNQHTTRPTISPSNSNKISSPTHDIIPSPQTHLSSILPESFSTSSPSLTSSRAPFELSSPTSSLPSATSSFSEIPSTSIHPMQTRAKANKTYPRIRTDCTIPWPLPRAHATSTAVSKEPTSITPASKYLKWRHVMQLEFDAFMFTNTWSWVPLASNQNIVGC